MGRLQVIGTSVVVRGPHGYLLRPATGAALHDAIYLWKGENRLLLSGRGRHVCMEMQHWQDVVGGEAREDSDRDVSAQEQ